MDCLAFDVGGTEIKYALLNEKADILEKNTVATPRDSLNNFLRTLEEIYKKYKGRIQGITLSLPGRIDSESGFSHTGGTLRYNDNQNIGALIKDRCNMPVAVENDGKCAALAEAWIGNLADCNNGIVVILGTYIGGGIILNKKLYKGSHSFAGEFTFIITDSAKYSDFDVPNRFGNYCGVPFLCRQVAKAKNMPLEDLNGHLIFELANKGDKIVLDVLDSYCETLAENLLNLQYVFDVEKIAIGGGISSQNILFEYLHKYIKIQEDILAKTITNIIVPKLVPCKFRNDSNLIGALYNFLNKYYT